MMEICITCILDKKRRKRVQFATLKSLFRLHLSFRMLLESNFPVPVHRVELARLDSPKHALASGQSDEFENATGR